MQNGISSAKPQHPCFVNSKQQFALLSNQSRSQSSKDNIGHATAPIITSAALSTIDAQKLPELGLFGSVVAQHGNSLAPVPCIDSWEEGDARIFVNINAPFSMVITGVQGSGKSHALAVVLESALIPSPHLGSLPDPLACVAFHFDSALGSGRARPCEAAYVSSIIGDIPGTAPEVTILVSPTCLKSMRNVYSSLPVTVNPFYLSASSLTANRLLTLMQVDDSGKRPLYMHAVLSILRQMGVDGFNYQNFRRQVACLRLNETQREMLDLRLGLLDSIIKSNVDKSMKEYYGKGKLVIVDLSDPFLDSNSACALFQIAMGIFCEGDNDNMGKLVVFDEAHKYLSQDAAAATELTADLLPNIRQQRHLGCRFCISTQEPTVIPSQILDLCSIILAFRFSSPIWASHLARHVSTGRDLESEEWFQQVVELATGEAALFAPAGLALGAVNMEGKQEAVRLARGYLTIRTRRRITADGGASLMASNAIADSNGSDIPYKPVYESDGSGIGVLQSICSMKEYSATSSDEIRWKDYQLGRHLSKLRTSAQPFEPAQMVAVTSVDMEKTNHINDQSRTLPAESILQKSGSPTLSALTSHTMNSGDVRNWLASPNGSETPSHPSSAPLFTSTDSRPSEDTPTPPMLQQAKLEESNSLEHTVPKFDFGSSILSLLPKDAPKEEDSWSD